MKCKLCNSTKTQLIFTANNVHGRHFLSDEQFRIYQCKNCQLVYTDIFVNKNYYKKYYPQNYYDWSLKTPLLKIVVSLLKQCSYKSRLQIINKYKPKGNKILEIGCAKGEFLDWLPSYFEKYGLEINKICLRYIKKYYKKIIVYNTEIDDKKFDNNGIQYDVIIMWHVLEHIANPKLFLNKIYKLLSKDGVLILEIPNRDSLGFKLTKQFWFHLDTPRHLFFYNYVCLKNLFLKYNLEIINYFSNPFDYFQDLSASIWKKLFKKNLLFIIINFLLLPITFIMRLIISLFVTKIAEVNTYIIKKSQ